MSDKVSSMVNEIRTGFESADQLLLSLATYVIN